MALDIYSTYYLLMVIKNVPKLRTFLRDRYFPTNDATDIFKTMYVLIEYKDGGKKLAPFVAPRKGGVPILRQGSYIDRFEPPNIAPKRGITLDDVESRGFGEALLSNMDPDQREAILIVQDLDELGDMISRREEAMAAETILNNGCVMFHIADDRQVGDEIEIFFYEKDKGEQNPAFYTPAIDWDNPDAPIIDDLDDMARFLTSRGLPASEFVCAPDVGKDILNNNKIQKLLDLKNYEIGGVKPEELPEGAVRLARLNIYGRLIDIIAYEETYEADDGTVKQYIPAGHGFMTAPKCGRTAYGAVRQMEEDKKYHVHAARRVPKYHTDTDKDTRDLTLKAKPLLLPNNKWPWIAAQVK